MHINRSLSGSGGASEIHFMSPEKFALGQSGVRTRDLSICSLTRYHWTNAPQLTFQKISYLTVFKISLFDIHSVHGFPIYTKKFEQEINPTVNVHCLYVQFPPMQQPGQSPYNHCGNSYYSQIMTLVRKTKCYRFT